jgi:Ca2+/Na+ antiporter
VSEIRPGLVKGTSFENINNVFFEQFFTVLIIADVVLLLFSFFYTDEFHKVMRNSGFIISTILLRLSFSVEGLLNTLLIITALLFGLLMLIIHNQFEKQLAQEEAKER